MTNDTKITEFPGKIYSENCNIQIAPGSSLDTLEITSEFQPDFLHLTKKSSLEKRAKSKFLNSQLSRKLADLNSHLKDQYWDTYYCSHIIEVSEKGIISKFCKKRWCIICNRIRTADLLQKYLPTLASWPDKTFLTLTIPNCAGCYLVATINLMLRNFTKIKDLCRKEGKNLVGIRKLEITYNRRRDDYHPHYHFILQNSENCEKIIQNWLRHFPTADRHAQDSRPADQNSCFELFKYFTKLTSNSSKDSVITVKALDHIFTCLLGVRTFQPFGFIPHKTVKPAENFSEEIENFTGAEFYKYQKNLSNWLNSETGEILTDFQPGEKEKNFKNFIH
jgi:hypothetical protein